MTQTFATRGCTVAMLDVYRRVAPRTDPKLLDAVEARWADTGIDMVALTSVETLSNLIALLSDHGRTLLRQTPMLVASHRILEAAEAAGMHGGGIVAAGADNASMLGALARWRMRARTLS
jgi:uroporphyrinogen-III synthase